MPTSQIDLAGLEPCQDIAPFLALFTAGEDRDAQAGALGQRRDGLDVLAGEDFGRRHQRRLFAGFRHGGRCDSATTVLPEPTSPCSSRSIRTGCSKSSMMAATASRCDEVSA